MLENVKAEEVVKSNEEVVEAVAPVVEQAVENVAKSGSSLGKTLGMIGGTVVGITIIYLGGKWIVKKLTKKDIEAMDEDGVVAEAEYNETSETENEEESDK